MAKEEEVEERTAPRQPSNVQEELPQMDYEVGLQLNLPFTTPFQSEDGDVKQEVYRSGIEDEPTVRQLVNMRTRDGQARALYRLITLPIRSALNTKKIVPSSDDGLEEADFIDQVFSLPPQLGGMQESVDNFISYMLMALFDGFSAFELVYHIPAFGPLDGRITLKKIAHRPSETVKFLIDDNGEFAGFRQQTMFKGEVIDVEIPKNRSLYFTVQEEERPFYGISFFQSAFFHYDKKDKLYYLAHLAAQHRAVGSRIGTIPTGASRRDVQKFRQALSDYGFAQGMTIPSGYKVQNEYPGAAFDFLDIINHHNSQMSKSVLAAFFDQAQGGDKAIVDFGHQSDAMFMMMLQAIMTDIAETINNKIIPRLIDWNFGTGEYPKFTWGAFTDDQKQSITKIFDRLATAGAGVNVSPDFMLELEQRMAEDLSLNIDYDRVIAQRNSLTSTDDEDTLAFRNFMNRAGIVETEVEDGTELVEPTVGLTHTEEGTESIPISDTIEE